jgi:hypothetical protein
LKGTQAANIEFRIDPIFTDGETGVVDIYLRGRNNGNMASPNVEGRINASVRSWPEGKPLVTNDKPISPFSLGGVSVARAEAAVMANSINNKLLSIPDIAGSIWKAVKSGKGFIEIDWLVNYNNGFDDIISYPH